MSERPRDEKEEKNEKDQGGWDEKWRRDPVDAAMWALLLVWAGIVLLMANLGVLDAWESETWVAVGFVGAGLIVLLTAAFRLLVPAYRRPLGGNLIFAAILVGIGLAAGDYLRWEVIGPLVLIAIGVGILLTGLLRRM
jgi:hypothetical protein